MADKKTAGNKSSKPAGSYSVSSTKRGQGKTVSFTVPTFPRPDMNKLRPTGRPSGRGLLAGLVVFLLAIGGGYFGAWLQGNDGAGLNSGSLSSQKKIVTSQSQLINQIAKTVGPSVVSVNVSITGGPQTDIFGRPVPPRQAAGAGTGIIISKEGLIITNRHVVPAGTTDVSVTLSDGTELEDVTVVGRTNSGDTLDVAFLKVNDAKDHKLEPAILGDSSQVQVGDAVVAIGNALGQFQNTVTSGIISGYGRSVVASDSPDGSGAENLNDLFQTDAAINEGNSGGPLVNMNGQVIGINTAVAGGDAENIGFAIPINDVKGLVDQVVATGKFARPYLGVRYIPLTADVAKEYDLKATNGAYIVPSADPSAAPSILPDSPAAHAGLQERDIITAVNGVKVDQTHSLTSLLSKYKPNDKVELTVTRGDDTKHITATLGTMPDSQNQ